MTLRTLRPPPHLFQLHRVEPHLVLAAVDRHIEHLQGGHRLAARRTAQLRPLGVRDLELDRGLRAHGSLVDPGAVTDAASRVVELDPVTPRTQHPATMTL
jgi:hypothetical protein